jgi:glyoxylase-like metal-dependent hydrolase (beta-lactamase superfamily II)
MTKVDIKILKSGYCLGNKNKVLSNSKSEIQKFYAGFALIEHPIFGKILFDTGYSKHFFEAVKHFPYSIYAKITPVTLDNEINLDNENIKYVIISHFHADHISGLKNFKNAKFICSKTSYVSIKEKTGFNAVIKGFLPDLLPEDFRSRLLFIEDISKKIKIEIFETCYDIFQDGSIIAVNLDGHTKGQIGIIVDSNQGGKFLISDACWNSISYKENILPPSYVLNLLGNRKEYILTLNKIHNFYEKNKNIQIIPSHCVEFWSNYNE